MSPDQDVYLEIGARPRPESMMLMSPLVFSKHASLVLPPSNKFTLVVDGEDEATEGEDSDVQDANTAGSRTPPQRTLYVQSEMGHGSAVSSGYASNSNPHLPLQPRPETPFQTMGVPPEINSGYLAPPGTWRTSYGRDILQRKERRQGWSGEWNQDDMQDVIKKLRNLK
ncbi:hypothetical protein FPV67DRAFT_1674918 [Lyophyllum atratum]|nr:hypothetical protein FPV67DRAFT_1674918 [Lyophyllum atratum]